MIECCTPEMVKVAVSSQKKLNLRSSQIKLSHFCICTWTAEQHPECHGRPGTIKLLLLVLSNEILNPTALVKGMMASAERTRRAGAVSGGRATVDRCSNLSSPVRETLALVSVLGEGGSRRAFVVFFLINLILLGES